MKKLVISVLVLLAVSVTICHAGDTDKSGLTLWGGSGESGFQEGRVGYFLAPWNLEPAFGVQHKDAPPEGEEQWPLRGYLFFHALDAEMLAKAFKIEGELPGGEIYAGPIAEYWSEREKEWSLGASVGGLVDLSDISPGMKGWYFYVEHEWMQWNVEKNTRTLGVGLCRRF